jgi:hypothetical protein
MDPNLVQILKINSMPSVEFYSSKYLSQNRIYTKRESLKLEQAENKLNKLDSK